MKEMKYGIEKKIEILYNDTYKGFEFYIMNLGTHPTAYIKIPNTHKYYGKHYDDINLYVHGGLTYSDDYLYLNEHKKIKGWFIGWDYAHYGDFVGYDMIFCENYTNKKWTTEEILKEIKNAIDQLEKEVV